MILVFTFALACALPPGAFGAGGTYTVVECDPLNRLDVDALLRDSAAYTAKDFCDDPAGDYSIQIGSRAHAIAGHRGLVRFPTRSAALGIVGANVDASLRGDGGSHPRLWLADDDLIEVDRIAGGDSPGSDFHHYSWTTNRPGASQFVASLTCADPDGCKKSDVARTWVKDVRLKVADYADPELGNLSGTVFEGVWISGVANLSAAFSDAGSGVAAVDIADDGTGLDDAISICATVAGTHFATTARPCPVNAGFSGAFDTSGAPFHDGANGLDICASDFAHNETCEQRTVMVDNAPPIVAFQNMPDSENPELIRAPTSDATSGMAAGRISYRAVGASIWQPLATDLHGDVLKAYVDSAAVPAGDYEFRAAATDVAGNEASTTLREDGQPMVLTFPLKAATRLRAHLVPGGARRETIGYGHDSKVSGRLLNASGAPIRREYVKVVEHFGSGALINRRVRKVRTNHDGFFGERIPAGPSRNITASYRGSKRFLTDAAKAGRLVVRSKAGFRTSRKRVKEGKSVVFHGRVHHRGARIPPGGKLVELQVRDGRFWNTVREAFYTHPDGRYRLRYRFRADYVSNARFRFRVKVAREQGWPYRAPVRTRARKLVVVAR